MQLGVRGVVDEILRFDPDLIIEREFNDQKAIYTDVYNYLDYPKALWSIDAHTDLVSHINYSKQFDYVFLAQSWFRPLFEKQTKARLFWLPLCHTQTITELNKTLKEFDELDRDIFMSFVGNIRSIHQDRKRFVAKLIKDLGNKFLPVQASYEKTLKLLRRSECTFNCSLNNDLNFRIWEALAMDTPIITDHVTDIDKISGLRERLNIYDKLESSIYSNYQTEVTNFCTHLNKSDFIKKNHTLTHRYLQMIQMIKTGEQYDF
jgi:hypothetical protein